MKRIIINLVVFLSLFGVAEAKDAADWNRQAHEGNALFQIAQYDKAIQKYEEILTAGYVSAELHYNLGNAYFRLKDYPQAILNYERALRLSPKDAEIKMNLDIANARIEDKIEEIPGIFFITWVRNLSNMFSLNVWGIIVVVFLIFTVGFTFIYLCSTSFYIKRTTFSLGILCLLLFLSSFGLGNQRYSTMYRKTEAIVFRPLVSVKSSPQETSVEKFVIHQGTKVQIKDELTGWIKIRLADGNIGWIEKEKVEVI